MKHFHCWKSIFNLHLQFILYHIWWFFRWKNTITTWHLTGMQLAIGMLIFNSLLCRQRAFWVCQTNPHWEGMSVNWSILHWKGTKSSLLTCTLRQFLRDSMVSFLFVLNLNLWTAAVYELICREHTSLEKEALSENTVSSNNTFLLQFIDAPQSQNIVATTFTVGNL